MLAIQYKSLKKIVVKQIQPNKKKNQWNQYLFTVLRPAKDFFTYTRMETSLLDLYFP
jgi:hypothetical protein